MRITYALLLSVSFSLIIPTLLVGYYLLDKKDQELFNELSAFHVNQTKLLASSVADSLWNFAPEHTSSLISAALEDKRIIRIDVIDISGELFASKTKAYTESKLLMVHEEAIKKEHRTIGLIKMTITAKDIESLLAQERFNLGATLFLQILVSSILLMLFFRLKILLPIQRLSAQSKRLKERKLDEPFEWQGSDELQSLGKELDRSRTELKMLFNNIEQKNISLMKTNEAITQKTQELQIQNILRKTILDTIPSPVFTQSFEGEIEEHNSSLSVALGIPLHENIHHYESRIKTFLNDIEHFDTREISTRGIRLKEGFCHLHGEDPIIRNVLLYQVELPMAKEKNILSVLVDITNMKMMQEQLLEQEKMAALGNLVAGLAHEVNTPLGVCVTASSALAHHINTLLQNYESDSLTTEAFDEYLCDLKEGFTILNLNLKKSADLINSFKQLASDQISEIKRPIFFNKMLDDIVLSLQPQTKIGKHSIDISCPALEVLTYPGLLAQVFTNLIMNSIKHGFENKTDGKIHIKVTRQSDSRIRVRYTDDGHGIPTEHLKRIYEPFFTTSRANGGTGLGLHIVYNIITQQLDGSLSCKSSPGKGTEFDFEFDCDTD